MNQNERNRLPQWVGIIVSVIVAIGASIGTYAARMNQTEQDVEVLKVQMQSVQSAQAESANLLKQINDRTIRIEEGMKLKADKVWEQPQK